MHFLGNKKKSNQLPNVVHTIQDRDAATVMISPYVTYDVLFMDMKVVE